MGLIAILTVVTILTKLIGLGWGARLTGFSTRSSLGIKLGVMLLGEMALIIARIDLESGLLDQDYPILA